MMIVGDQDVVTTEVPMDDIVIVEIFQALCSVDDLSQITV